MSGSMRKKWVKRNTGQGDAQRGKKQDQWWHNQHQTEQKQEANQGRGVEAKNAAEEKEQVEQRKTKKAKKARKAQPYNWNNKQLKWERYPGPYFSKQQGKQKTRSFKIGGRKRNENVQLNTQYSIVNDYLRSNAQHKSHSPKLTDRDLINRLKEDKVNSATRFSSADLEAQTLAVALLGIPERQRIGIGVPFETNDSIDEAYRDADSYEFITDFDTEIGDGFQIRPKSITQGTAAQKGSSDFDHLRGLRRTMTVLGPVNGRWGILTHFPAPAKTATDSDSLKKLPTVKVCTNYLRYLCRDNVARATDFPELVETMLNPLAEAEASESGYETDGVYPSDSESDYDIEVD